MEKDTVLKALKELKDKGTKRKFTQSVDLVVNLKDLDLKNPEHQVEFFAALHHERGRKPKICALIGPEMRDEAKATCDNFILIDDFDKYAQNKKLTKKLAETHDFFIGQANIMPKIAAAFGKVLGTRGKMPSPKAGCIVPPKTQLKPLIEKLQKMVKVSAKTSTIFQCCVGKEDSKEEIIAENVVDLYSQLVQHLPNGENNIKSAYLKYTMSKPVKIK